MPTIYLICGFLGFGKTTYAKKLAQETGAIRFTHDELMRQRYGRAPDNFQEKFQEVDKFIRQETQKAVTQGKDVILDYGFWSKEVRAEYYHWAKSITPNVVFHAVVCDIDKARQRVLTRTQKNPNELFIDAACFDNFLKQYTPLTKAEGYPIFFYDAN